MPLEHPNYVLVTGGAGFIGSSLIEYLLSVYDHTIIYSLDNYFTGAKENHIKDSRTHYVVGNTQDIFKIWNRYQLPRPEVVFHLGEYSRIGQSFSDFDVLWDSNFRGTKEVIKFCNSNRARLIYAGSSSKFGNEGRDENISPYAWIKAKNVELIINYSQWYELNYVIVYFFNVYGPRQIKNGPYATVIGAFEDNYINKKSLEVVSPGTQTRDFTHVDDIVRGIVLCNEKGNGDGYLLGTGEETSILDVVAMFGCDYILLPPRRGERERGRADNSKAKAIGWVPQKCLSEYISEFIIRVNNSRENNS
jgi:UDP-glucose 4-epimerase